jgi:hypothetical protein
VAISTSADATGSYNRYSYQFSTFPGYPKLSVWQDAYYTTYNMFTASGTFLNAEACAMDRAQMLTGAAATRQCFTESPPDPILSVHHQVFTREVYARQPCPVTLTSRSPLQHGQPSAGD